MPLFAKMMRILEQNMKLKMPQNKQIESKHVKILFSNYLQFKNSINQKKKFFSEFLNVEKLTVFFFNELVN